MHDSALRIGELVMQTYCDLPNARILEIGSMNVNGTLRSAAAPTTEYIGVDLEAGPGVDVVMKPGDKLPFDDASFDLIIASSAFEHDPRFWDTFIDMCRVTRSGGHIYVNAPSNGGVHRYPLDCWRFYPDAGLALKQYAAHNQIEVDLVESFVGRRLKNTWDAWNDFVAIFRRGPCKEQLNANFVLNRYPSMNPRTWVMSKEDYQSAITEDMELGRDLRQQITDLETQASQLRNASANLEQQVQALSGAVQAQTETIGRLERQQVESETEKNVLTTSLRVAEAEVAQLRSTTASLDDNLQSLSSSFQAHTDAFSRIQARDLSIIRTLEGDLARSLTSQERNADEVKRLKSELEASSTRLQASSAELERSRSREQELQNALDSERGARKRESAQHDSDRQALQWLRAIYTAIANRPFWWSLLPARSRRNREYELLRTVGLFDDRSYLTRYPDVAAEKADPLDHYINHGMHEGRTRS